MLNEKRITSISRGMLISIVLFSLLIIDVQALAASDYIKAPVCSIMIAVKTAIEALGGTLVIIMFTYGGLKYIFSADDAGGRKAGKMTCIHAVIGGILVVLASNIMAMLTSAGGTIGSC